MIHIQIKAPKFSRTRIAQLGGAFTARITQLAREAYGYARQPQKQRTLRVRTGRLMASITRVLRRRGPVIEAGVASSHPGAAALEYGASRGGQRIEPRTGRVLRFTIGGETVYSRYANIPPVTLPPHPFLRPSVRRAARDLRKDVRQLLKDAASARG